MLWLSVLLKDTSVTTGIRTHILLLTPELESGKLDRSATTPHIFVVFTVPYFTHPANVKLLDPSCSVVVIINYTAEQQVC